MKIRIILVVDAKSTLDKTKGLSFHATMPACLHSNKNSSLRSAGTDMRIELYLGITSELLIYISH